MTAIEPLPGGFTAVYPVLRRLEETGRIRRGYFVAGLGAAQFAQPGAVDLLRAAARRPRRRRRRRRWPPPIRPIRTARCCHGPIGRSGDGSRASRSAGARVVLVDGRCAAWIARGDRQLLIALPEEEPERSRIGRALARELVRLAYDDPPSAAAG